MQHSRSWFSIGAYAAEARASTARKDSCRFLRPEIWQPSTEPYWHSTGSLVTDANGSTAREDRTRPAVSTLSSSLPEHFR